MTAVRSATPPKFQTEGLILMAYVQAAQYDAATKVAGRYAPYHDFTADPAGASLDAAVATATYETLVTYLGDPGGVLAAKYAATLAGLPAAGRAQGAAVGHAASADLVALRAGDGRNAPTAVYGTPGPVIAGAWQVVPPATTAQTPWVAFMRPFVLDGTAQFRPDPPPALTSSRYARDFNETKALGALGSPMRTPEQTATALFWNANTIDQYNRALRDVATTHGMDALDTVRLLTMGNMVVSDAGMACFDAKYAYLFWRPYTAIRNAALDGNPRTAADSGWTALLNTPNHPEYPSAHGCVSSAIATVLARALHTGHIDVDVWGAQNGAVTLTTMRHYDTVEQMKREIADARVWIGFHFRNSMTAGLDLGTRVARYDLRHAFGPAGRADDGGDEADDR